MVGMGLLPTMVGMGFLPTMVGIPPPWYIHHPPSLGIPLPPASHPPAEHRYGGVQHSGVPSEEALGSGFPLIMVYFRVSG